MHFIIKILASALLVAAVSEIAKRSSVFAAVVASLPITSTLAFIWLYLDTGDSLKVAELSWQIIWLLIPSVAFFSVLSLALQGGMNFWLALGLAALITSACYGLTLYVMSFFQ